MDNNIIFLQLESSIIKLINSPTRVNGNDKDTRLRQQELLWCYTGKIDMAVDAKIITNTRAQYLQSMIDACSNDREYIVD